MINERRKFGKGKALVFAVLLAVLAFLSVECASAAAIYVPDNYSKIQWAVDNASAGDTIIVRDGTYTENVDVNKRLTIKSENGSDLTVVQASNPYGHVFEVRADYVNVSGLTVEGASHYPRAGLYFKANYCNISNNNAPNNSVGIYLSSSDSNILINNTVSDNEYGIYLNDYSYHNKVENNSVSNNGHGIYLKYSSNNEIRNNTFVNDGLFVFRSYRNIVEDNTVNGKLLVYLEDKSDQEITNAGQVILVKCDNITVENLALSNASIGVELFKTKNSSIKNITASNNRYGIYLKHSDNNTITNNKVSNNHEGIYFDFYCNKNTLMNNIASSNYYGIDLIESADTTLTNNIANFNEYGIDIAYSSGCTLKNNTANSNKGSGIALWSLNNCRIENNTANSNAVGISLKGGSRNCNIINNTANSNKWLEGIKVEYSNNCRIENNNANSNVYYGIRLISSDSNLVTNNNVTSNVRYGILVVSSDNNTIISNNASNNNRRGIYLCGSKNNMLIGNNINLNKWDGIYLTYLNFPENPSDCNTIINNTISNNECGIRLKSSNSSIIYLNNFVNNSDNVYSSSNLANIWNSTEKITHTYKGKTYENYLGNYWDDYTGSDADGNGIGDNPYSIDSDQDYHPLMEPWEIYFAPTENIFDTEAPANPYPSIMGNHTGSIKPNHTVIATKLYTYPCIGTGGHTEYAKIWNLTWNATATWEGYAGNWHNITFDKTVVLLANETYNYTIRTGSYPQIHHTDNLEVANNMGTITCDKFIDANGRVYYDRIPAIRLWRE